MKASLYIITLIKFFISILSIPARCLASDVKITENPYWLCLSTFQRWLMIILFFFCFAFILILLSFSLCERLLASCDQWLTVYLFWSQLLLSSLTWVSDLLKKQPFQQSPTLSCQPKSLLDRAQFPLTTHAALSGWLLNFKACHLSLLSLSFCLFFLCH